jgi:hypothetical protein
MEDSSFHLIIFSFAAPYLVQVKFLDKHLLFLQIKKQKMLLPEQRCQEYQERFEFSDLGDVGFILLGSPIVWHVRASGVQSVIYRLLPLLHGRSWWSI